MVRTFSVGNPIARISSSTSSPLAETNDSNFEYSSPLCSGISELDVYKRQAPQRDENQLHAAIVEIVVHKDAEVKYSTVQNWYPGDKDGKGGVYNFVTKRALCDGDNAKVSWTQVETGSALSLIHICFWLLHQTSWHQDY